MTENPPSLVERLTRNPMTGLPRDTPPSVGRREVVTRIAARDPERARQLAELGHRDIVERPDGRIELLPTQPFVDALQFRREPAWTALPDTSAEYQLTIYPVSSVRVHDSTITLLPSGYTSSFHGIAWLQPRPDFDMFGGDLMRVHSREHSPRIELRGVQLGVARALAAVRHFLISVSIEHVMHSGTAWVTSEPREYSQDARWDLTDVELQLVLPGISPSSLG